MGENVNVKHEVHFKLTSNEVDIDMEINAAQHHEQKNIFVRPLQIQIFDKRLNESEYQ